MKKLLLPLAAIMLLAFAVPAAFAGVEFGTSWTSTSFLSDTSLQSDSILGFHAAYDWFILTASVDSLAMPSAVMADMTGVAVPGFLNMFDAGLNLKLGIFQAEALIGTNYVYFYKGLGPSNGSWGANLRLLGGLNFGWWGIGVSGTSAFDTFDTLVSTIKGLFDTTTRDKSISDLTSGLVPAIYLTFYF